MEKAANDVPELPMRPLACAVQTVWWEVDMEAMTVGALMTQNVDAVSRNTPLVTVFELMIDGDYRHVPVVDDEEEFVGIISERDLLQRVSAF